MGGDWSWFTGWFEVGEKPPEALVLGAELRCPYGSKHTFLMVETDHIDINNLPKACVDDCKKLFNIEPFGQCYGGAPCEEDMELESKWENPEPQNELINGKEIITTKSVLLCKERGMEIQAVTSGQEGVMAARWALYAEIEKQFPGLLAILLDPYGSLYLNEGMYEIAITFLLDRIVKNGGEIFFPSIYGKDDPEGELIRAALERLLPDCDASACDRLINGLENTGYLTGMDEVKGWDVNSLNLQMIVMLRKDCAATDKKIKTDTFARLTEENKVFTSSMSSAMTQIAYGAIMFQAMQAKPVEEPTENPFGKIKEKLKDKFGEGGTEDISFKAPKITVNSKGELTNGLYTLNQSDMLVHVDGKNPYKSQFLYDVDQNKAVLDAAAYANKYDLWTPSSGNPADFANKAKIYVENGPVGVTGQGELTDYINVYRTKTGYIHGCPGNR